MSEANTEQNQSVSLTTSQVGLEERLAKLETPSKRRDKLCIIAEILRIVKEGVLKTQIMYRGNLSFEQLTDYLNFMLKKELLEIKQINGKDIYFATEKGIKILNNYREITELVGTDYIDILYSKDGKTFVRK